MTVTINIIKKITTVCLVTCLFGCALQKSANFDKQYLTFNLTHTTNTPNHFVMENYMYDFESDEVTLKSELTYNSQYPLSYYDQERDVVYYTSKTDENYNDNLFEYNCQTKESTQLTEDVYAVNSISKVSDNEIAFTAAVDDRNVRLFVLDLTTKQYEVVDIDDFSISSESYNPKEKSIVFSGYMASQRDDLMDKWNSDLISDEELILNDIFYEYHFDTKELTKITESSQGVVYSSTSNEDDIYYLISNVVTGEHHVRHIDRNTKEDTTIDFPSNIYRFIAVSEDSDTIIYSTDASLQKYQFSNQQKTTLFNNPEDTEGIINNGFLGLKT